LIEFNHVSKRFGAVLALADVSFHIRNGERVAFVGSNGSGKTTLLRSLLGLLRVEGKIRIAGVDVAKAPELALRNVAYIPQVAPPLDASVAEVIRAHARLRGITTESIGRCAERLELSTTASARARFRDLSGGMRQKLLAALALASDAHILICDEPTANLDNGARSAFFEELARLPPDRIVVVCSHRFEEVQSLVGRVLTFGEGRVTGDASHEAGVALSDVTRVERVRLLAGVAS
jgi:ABC-type multidrug transport system ATPase subunit